MAEELPPSPGAAALAAIDPEVHVHRADASLPRVWFAGSRHPSGFAHFRTFGPTTSRFDHHLPAPDGAPVSGVLSDNQPDRCRQPSWPPASAAGRA